MFFLRNKERKIKISKRELKSYVITSMYLMSINKDRSPNPLVTASPEEIAEVVAEYIFWNPSLGKENSSPSS